MQISGSTVLLTGATGGIGRAIASALASRGASLIVTGRHRDVLDPLAAEHGGRALAVDLAIREDVERLVREAGEVDILVANAALPASGALESFTVDEIDRALDVNMRAPMVLAHALAPAMVAKDRGHLLFTSSLLGKAASPGTAVYSATKFGLRVCQCVARRLERSRHRCVRCVSRRHPRSGHVRRNERGFANRTWNQLGGGRGPCCRVCDRAEPWRG
jgi:short-subunit dehydrogenase